MGVLDRGGNRLLRDGFPGDPPVAVVLPDPGPPMSSMEAHLRIGGFWPPGCEGESVVARELPEVPPQRRRSGVLVMEEGTGEGRGERVSGVGLKRQQYLKR